MVYIYSYMFTYKETLFNDLTIWYILWCTRTQLCVSVFLRRSTEGAAVGAVPAKEAWDDDDGDGDRCFSISFSR